MPFNKTFYPLGGSPHSSALEECNICKRPIKFYSLKPCFRCKKLVCQSCITEDLYESRYLVCLECARRSVMPQKFFHKTLNFSLYLSRKAKRTRWLKLSFSEIEGILIKNLPASAFETVEWWNKNSVSRAWLDIGWKIKDVDLKAKTVTFTRPNILKKREKPKRKNSLSSLPKYKPLRRKKPSLTRIAKAQARLQNIARSRNSLRRYKGKFKPKSIYEKKLYKEEEKP